MIENTEKIREDSWQRVKTIPFLFFSACLLGLFYLIKTTPDGFVVILDSANLVFHEAGHIIFGIFGETMGFLGGTLGQLAFPVVTMIIFWYRRETISFAIMGIWFFENLINSARYMADARAQVLPLVGGGIHDWAQIFGHWGILDKDTIIAGVVKIVGIIGMVGLWLWVCWRFKIDSLKKEHA
jgi:hypothetical protein